jgi:hypothetical protein
MDIHKPKPWHGLREFLKEYVIIVVGVLTALGAEQAVEWLHWRHEVHVASVAIAYDLKRMVGGAAAQDGHSACTAAHLHEIGEALDQAQVTKRLPPLGFILTPPHDAWGMQSWATLTSGQTLSHFPNREQLVLSSLQAVLMRMEELNAVELDDWATMRIVFGRGRPITDPEIATVRVALQHAYKDAAQLKSLSRFVETMVAQSGLLTGYEIDAAYKEGVALNATAGACRPALPPGDASEVLGPFLSTPAERPGAGVIINPGVGHAIATDK